MIHLKRGLLWAVAAVILLSKPASIMPDGHIPHSKYEVDPRLVALSQFLDARQSPITHLAEDFLIAADKHGLDWRLLPSIAFIESSAGKAYRNNNIFGWNNAMTEFPNIRTGIYYVGSRLGESEIYRGKTFEEKLALYNPYDHYAPAVIRVARILDRLEEKARTQTATVSRTSEELAELRQEVDTK